MTEAWDRRTCVAQLQQYLEGWNLVERRGASYRTTDECRALLDRWGGIGVVYGLFRTDPWTGRDLDTGIPAAARPEVSALLQDAVRGASGGIGALLATDSPHGDMSHGAVGLPVNLAQAATWSADLVREAADVVGRSIRSDGTHLALCSGLDMLRDPRWGRSEETYGEDPVLAARLIAAQVRGLQGGDTLHPETHPGAVVKHLAGQGQTVGGRNATSASLGPAELAEIHLPPARAAVAAGAVGFMAAYNDIDGIPCATNRWLLTELLREHWGFDGVVMSDALAIDRAAENLGPRVAAWRALQAGCDLDMGDASWAELAVPGDEAQERALREAAARVRSLKERFGLLRGQSEACPAAPPADDLLAASRSLARAAITVLGEQPAPIPPGSRVLVVGPFADSAESLLGDYSTPLLPGRARSLAHAVSQRFPGTVAAGGGTSELLAAAASADVVVVQLGGTSERRYGAQFAATGANVAGEDLAATCGEGVDVADLRLPHDQDDVLRALRAATSARIIGVAIMGRPHVLTAARRSCDDLLVAWYPGPTGADAIVDVLAGTRSAPGRLPVTLLRHPGAQWHDNERVGAVESPYRDVADPVLAPLGAGATTSLRLLSWHLDRVAAGAELQLEVAAGEHCVDVVRVFGRRGGALRWPRRRVLLDFVRVELDPGEERRLVIPLSDDLLFDLAPRGPGLGEPDRATSCLITALPFDVATTLHRTEGECT